MKVVNKKSKRIYEVVTLNQAEGVTLRSLNTGKVKTISPKIFKLRYELTDELISQDDELDKVEEIVEDIIEDLKNVENPKTKKSTKKKKEPKPTKKSKPKTSKEGITTLKDICEELELDPKKSRIKLRKADAPKPEGRWEWTNEKDIKKIKKILKG